MVVGIFLVNGKKKRGVVLADYILKFYEKLKVPDINSFDVESLEPFQDARAWAVMQTFFRKYYSDNNMRIMLIGINPGRFGGGTTGIPFTDPINLQHYCDIPNDFPKHHELSSRFMYDMISAFGGPDKFYSRYYFYSVSPVGFTRSGKNFNYYDDKDLKTYLEDFIVRSMRYHLESGMTTDIAYSIGQGKNVEVMYELNNKYKFFKEIKPLPHPRWVMQYKLKSKDQYIDDYLRELE